MSVGAGQFTYVGAGIRRQMMLDAGFGWPPTFGVWVSYLARARHGLSAAQTVAPRQEQWG
jgi:hypothetical protein